MTDKRRGSSPEALPARGKADRGRLAHPARGPGGKAKESAPDRPQSAPMHGTPLPEREMERLKERAKSTPLHRSIPSQEDPSTKK